MAKTYRHLLSPFTWARIYHMSHCETCQVLFLELLRRSNDATDEALKTVQTLIDGGAKPRCDAHGLIACMWCDSGPDTAQGFSTDAVSAYPQMTDGGHDFLPLESFEGCGHVTAGHICLRAEGHPIHHPGWENVAPAVQPGM